LERNIGLNRFDNIAVAPVALSDESGEAIFHLGPLQNSGISSLRIHRESAGTTTIKTITFDEVWNQDKPVHLFKIDVEGAEAKVLRGMSRCLNRWAPNIVLEVTDDALHKFGDSAANLCNCLIDRGYSMYWIEWNGLRPLAGWTDDLPSQFNAFFTTQSSRQLPLPLIEGVLVNTS
jgi:FkbM family methyltransferase